MLKWVDRLDRRIDELALLLTLESGKAIPQSRGEIAGSISEIRLYAGIARCIPGHGDGFPRGAVNLVSEAGHEVTRELGDDGIRVSTMAPGVTASENVAGNPA